jgi:hypothetical protein
MEHGEHNYSRILFHKKHFVRETPGQSPANVLVDDLVLLWSPNDTAEYGVRRQEKIGAQPKQTRFIPIKRFSHFGFSLGPDDQLATQVLFLIRSRTVAQGDPWSGF